MQITTRKYTKPTTTSTTTAATTTIRKAPTAKSRRKTTINFQLILLRLFSFIIILHLGECEILEGDIDLQIQYTKALKLPLEYVCGKPLDKIVEIKLEYIFYLDNGTRVIDPRLISKEQAAFRSKHVLVKRCPDCEGMCDFHGFSCQASKKRMLYYQLRPIPNYNGLSHGVEVHDECKCACHIKANDCSHKHYYEDCGCKCKEPPKCSNDHYELKEATCECECKNQQTEDSCPTNHIFDAKNCTCVKAPTINNALSWAERRRLITKAMPINN